MGLISRIFKFFSIKEKPKKVEPKNIVEFNQTSIAFPSQWEGKLKDGRMFYIRFRYDTLSMELSKEKTNDIYDAIDGELIFCEKMPYHATGGVMSTFTAIEHMRKCGFVFPSEQIVFTDKADQYCYDMITYEVRKKGMDLVYSAVFHDYDGFSTETRSLPSFDKIITLICADYI